MSQPQHTPYGGYVPGAGYPAPSPATAWPATASRHGWRNPALGTEIAVATGVMVAVALVGIGLGVLWALVAPGPTVLMTEDGPVHANPTSEAYFAADGWFLLIGAVTGILAAVICWWVVRRYRGPVVLMGLVLGCLLAALIAWQVGRHIGLEEFRTLLADAPPGRSLSRPVVLSAWGVLGVQAFTAAFCYTMLAGWSRFADLRPHPAGQAPELAYLAPQVPPPQASPQTPPPPPQAPPRPGAAPRRDVGDA